MQTARYMGVLYATSPFGELFGAHGAPERPLRRFDANGAKI